MNRFALLDYNSKSRRRPRLIQIEPWQIDVLKSSLETRLRALPNMNDENSRIAEAVKAIESVAPDGYGRMNIPCEMDEELQEQIQFALTCEPRSQFLLNQFGFDTLLRFVERRASECLREPEFQHCQHAAQALEVLLFQPEFDAHTVDVALALVHDAYQHLQTPRPDFDARELPLFTAAWQQINTKLAEGTTCSEHHFRVGADQDGPRYICYW